MFPIDVGPIFLLDRVFFVPYTLLKKQVSVKYSRTKSVGRDSVPDVSSLITKAQKVMT